ncbi:putative mannan endo-1,4-beta-mannosidase C [Gossypium arboreum]|uniref:Putative mannan endo-1,4-beta-mannosidase C n=1 Tax=Gossypium arboreum TaxID=29729 RepID=A0A0B0PVZ8_GOSAR|nr:putative mannan endo-1,4-beta-mannosidase C [Gossypium arboreum]
MSETRPHYQLDLLGIVSLNILSMACIGTWSFFYVSYWSSQMYWLMMIVDLFLYSHEIWFIVIIGL